MPSFSEFSTTPDSNTSAGGTSIAENCPAANVNNVIRYTLACGRALYDTVSGISGSGGMPITGGAFTGNITRSGAGAYWYFNSSSLVGGQVYVQPVSSALPTSPAEGTVVFQY